MSEEDRIDQLLKAYLKKQSIQGKDISNIKYSAGLFLKYLSDNRTSLFNVKLADAQEFQGFLITKTRPDGSVAYSKATVSNIITGVSGFYDYLKEKHQIFSNPFYHVKRVKRNKALPKNIPDEEELCRFLNQLRAFNKPDSLFLKKRYYRAHVLAETLYSTGIRINEAAGIKEKDIDLLKGVIRIADTKSGKEREVILNDYAKQVLQIYLTMRNFILSGKSNKVYLFGSVRLKTWFNSFLKKESRKAGLNHFTSHCFRHAVGYHLLKNGCDIRCIQEILGHNKLSTTQVYTRVNKEELKNVIDQYHPRTFAPKERNKNDD